MTDNCALLNEKEQEGEHFLPLMGFWGVWSQYHGVFFLQKIGYAIKLNIVMLEWSCTQLWSPDATWKKPTKTHRFNNIINNINY